MIRTCVLVKRIPLYIIWGSGAPKWRGSYCQEERVREMEMQWRVVGSRSPWRKARALSLQTCSDLYQILRGSSIRRDEHHCGVGFRIQWLDFRILVGWFIPKKISEKNLWMSLKHSIYLSLWWLVEVLYGRLFF